MKKLTPQRDARVKLVVRGEMVRVLSGTELGYVLAGVALMDDSGRCAELDVLKPQ